MQVQKITATNTWNFALIDYFADLTLLRNGPDDQSELPFALPSGLGSHLDFHLRGHGSRDVMARR